MTSTTTRCMIYTRISKDQAGRRLGVDRQEAACRELAGSLGWQVVHIYTDNDESAGKEKDPPEYRDMIAACEAGLADAIIVAKVDRLHRQFHKFATFMQWRKKHGVKFATTEGDNTETAGGRTILNVKAVLAQDELERIQERVNAAVRQRAERGQFNGGRLPYYVSHPEAGAWVQQAARDILDGRSLHSIAKEWNGKGRRTELGNPWIAQVIKKMLVNPSAIGQRELDGQLFSVPWKPILDHTTWTNVRAILTDPSRKAHEVNQRRHALSGLVYCVCGNMMTNTGPKAAPSFECSGFKNGCGRTKILMAPLELFVAEGVFFTLDTPAFKQAMADQKDDADDTAAQLMLTIANDRQSLVTLEDEKDDGLIDDASYRRRRARITARIDSNQAALPRTRSSLPPGDELRIVWPTKDPGWQRQIVSEVIDRIDVSPHPRGVSPLSSRRPQESLEDCHRRWMATVDARTTIRWTA